MHKFLNPTPHVHQYFTRSKNAVAADSDDSAADGPVPIFFILDTSNASSKPACHVAQAHGKGFLFTSVPEKSFPSETKIKKMLQKAYMKDQVCGFTSKNLEEPCTVIAPGFFEYALDTSNIFVAAGEQTARNTIQVHSFILARRLKAEKHVFYVELLCAKTPPGSSSYAFTGRTLLTMAIEYAKTKRFTEVRLSAIPNVISKYLRWDLGFQIRKSCSKDDAALVISKELTELPLFVGTGCVREKPETYRNPIYRYKKNKPHLNLMMAARRLGQEHPHPGKDAACKSLNMTSKMVEEKGCDSDGYYMRKCFSNEK